jgi:tripartite-type tricarboxylate transporter receptor subunit TctC
MKKLLAFITTMLISVSALAWPTKSITLIVPYPPGGLIDKFARAMQKDFQDKISVPVEVQYMPGAALAVATTHVLNRPNDNHTFIVAEAGFVVGPALLGTKTYREFVPVALIGESPYVMFVSGTGSDSKIRQQIRNQDIINVGVANQGEIWLNDLKWPTKLNLIPYKGLAPMVNDVLPGHTEYGVLAYTGIGPSFNNGQVRPVLVFGDRRLPQMPTVPTANELGFSGSYTHNWYAVWARQDTDRAAVTEMSRLVQDSTNTSFKDLLGLTVLNYGPQRAAQYANREAQIFERIAEKNKK